MRHYSVYRLGSKFIAVRSEFAHGAIVWSGLATYATVAAEAARERYTERV